MPLATSQALSQKVATPRDEDGDVSRSASPSPSPSPRQRPRRLPGGHYVGDSGQLAPREAWASEGGMPPSPQHGHEQKGSARGGAGGKPRRGGGCPPAPQMSQEWHGSSLFGGERCANPKAKRAFATTFRRPTSSRATPHRRPIFVVGPDAQDPRMCVDLSAPTRFSSLERTRYEHAWQQAKPSRSEGSRAMPEATIRNIGKIPAGPANGRVSVADGRGTPGRPGSVASVGTFRSAAPSPSAGQRFHSRPASSTPAPRVWPSDRPSTVPAMPAAWSGA